MKDYQLTEFIKSDQQEVKSFILNILIKEFGFEPNPVWDADLDNPDKKYKDNGGIFYVLKDEGKIVGTIALYPHSKTVIELKRLYVDKSHRGSGLGKILMDKALNYCKEKGYKKIILDTWNRLTPAIKLYEKYGFKEYKREEEQVFMYLDLN